MKSERSSERLMFFTDAVVAIALTLLVLPLTELVPELVAEHAPASEAITHNWAKIFSFVLSFAVIGRSWFTHHRTFEHVRAYSGPLVAANFCWLLTIALLPFPTQLIGAYPPDRFTVVFYLGTLLAGSLCHTVLVFLVRRDPQIRGDAEPVSDETLGNFVLSTGVFVLAVVVALIKPGLGYYALLLLFFPSIISRRVLRRRL
ncbi:TMEM175 family protein [Amycolatopsis sp. lyj-109]|uniref:TMEM175 family protein n=1 Tax=Amycolatopsis sp. lyj-109 TaxID=2789287 RepID=UPI00397CD41F